MSSRVTECWGMGFGVIGSVRGSVVVGGGQGFRL